MYSLTRRVCDWDEWFPFIPNKTVYSSDSLSLSQSCQVSCFNTIPTDLLSGPECLGRRDNQKYLWLLSIYTLQRQRCARLHWVLQWVQTVCIFNFQIVIAVFYLVLSPAVIILKTMLACFPVVACVDGPLPFLSHLLGCFHTLLLWVYNLWHAITSVLIIQFQ